MSATSPIAVVSELWRYPVKSMLGEQVPAVPLTARGLLGDRAYAVIDRETGHIVSAKHPRKWPAMFACQASFVEPPQEGRPLPTVRIRLPRGDETDSSVKTLDNVLSAALGRGVTLAQVDPVRASRDRYQVEMTEMDSPEKVLTFETPAGLFFDLSVLHLLTTATLARLQEQYLRGRFDGRRFRPNVVLVPSGGAKGFVENDWVGRTVRIGSTVRVQITEPCSRCVMTTLPQGELPHDPGILKTAVVHNQGNVGVHAAVLQPGLLRQGDECWLE